MTLAARTPAHTSSDELASAANAIENGALVVVPTRRWYMLCADASNDNACQRIFTAKSRPSAKPLCLVVPSLSVASDQFDMSPAAQRLANALWPGDLAMLLRWRDPAHGAAGAHHAGGEAGLRWRQTSRTASAP